MCYLIAKEFDKKGCIAVKTRHGKALADFTEKLQKQMGERCAVGYNQPPRCLWRIGTRNSRYESICTDSFHISPHFKKVSCDVCGRCGKAFRTAYPEQE